MDGLRSFDEPAAPIEAEPHHEVPAAIDRRERRMQVRAYAHWVGLLGQGSCPAIADLLADLEAGAAADFGDHAVLLDFTAGLDDPAIRHLGAALREECDAPGTIETVADVPGRSLLSRLTDHCLQILANRAPIGFEAEFVSRRGRATLYRGILMPFSSDGETIDFVYGVINWKELAEPAEAAGLAIEMERAIRMPAASCAPRDVWTDSPAGPPPAAETLADHLAAARDLVERSDGVRLRSQASLYRALGLAYDFALLAEARPEDYAALLVEAGIRVQARAPMMAIVRLVFGDRADKARATEFAAALAQARRIGLGVGAFRDHVEARPGGLKAMVAAERIARRPLCALPSHAQIARAALRKVPARAIVDLPSDGGEFVLLLARRDEAGRLAVLAPVPEEPRLLDQAIRRITR